MTRSDRLFDLIQILRDGRLHRGKDLADTLGVSLRTLYRDMDTLIASRVPIEGERGLGYMMTAPITLPPLNLTLQELDALHLGLSVVSKATDEDMRQAADSLAAKVDAVLPEDRSAPAAGLGFAVYPFAEAARGFAHVAPLRAAIRSKRKVRLGYRDRRGHASSHRIRPLQIEYWGRVWTLTGWCDAESDFRVFRVDRIETLDVTQDSFEDEPGKMLSDYLARTDFAPD